MARVSRFAVAAITSIAIGLLLTYGSYVLGFWAGGHRSMRLVLISLVLLPVFLGLFAATWPSPKPNRSALVAGISGAAIGLACCYLATRVMFWVTFKHWAGFGPIAWDLDLETLACGAIAGACAMLVAISRRGLTVVLSVAILVTIGVFAPRSAFNFITRNQELTVAVVTPLGSSPAPESPEVNEQPNVSPIDVGNVTNRVLRSLGDAGIAGKYQVVDLYRQGQGKPVLAIIAISEPVPSRTDLPEPCGTDAIYLQARDVWRTIPAQTCTIDPSQVRTFNRTIMIWPPGPEDRDLGQVMITDASGYGRPFWIPRTVH